jgi:hypothetical protein
MMGDSDVLHKNKFSLYYREFQKKVKVKFDFVPPSFNLDDEFECK